MANGEPQPHLTFCRCACHETPTFLPIVDTKEPERLALLQAAAIIFSSDHYNSQTAPDRAILLLEEIKRRGY